MVNVTILPYNVTNSVKQGEKLSDIIRSAGISFEMPCNGNGTCGKCTVRIQNSNSQTKNMHSDRSPLSYSLKKINEVLACQTFITDDVTVELSTKGGKETLTIIDTGFCRPISLEPDIRKIFNDETNKTTVFSGTELLTEEEKDTTKEIYGVVIDIGTTTLVVSLCDIRNGKTVAKASSLNPQSLHSHDVLTRISIASEEHGLTMLHNLLIDELNRLIGVIAEEKAVSVDRIYEVVISSNTCMLHLATKTNPYSLGFYPFTIAMEGIHRLWAKQIGLNINPKGFVYLPPTISAFVGADITSGILATDLQNSKECILFIDIGTNGEMVLAKNGQLAATSTAAGPAFECMNITSGMRAQAGAIERVAINERGELTLTVIGNVEPEGVCGSGLLDAVAELVRTGIIEPSGRFTNSSSFNGPKILVDRLEQIEKKTFFRLSDQVFLSQKDIRQVQLAKAAIRTGINLLLRHLEVQLSQIDSVFIAGSFGYHLSEDSLFHTGLIPTDFRGKIQFIGNTSLSGGTAFLLNRSLRIELQSAVKQIASIDLSRKKDFQDEFIKNISFGVLE